MRLRGGGERVAMADVDTEHAVAKRGEDPARDLGERGALGGVVEEHGAAQRRRLGGEPLGGDRLQRAGGLAVAHPVAAERQRLQILVGGGAAEAVEDHVGAAAAGGLAHRAREAVVARDDGRLAAVGARQPRLVLGGDGADAPGRPGPAPTGRERARRRRRRRARARCRPRARDASDAADTRRSCP